MEPAQAIALVAPQLPDEPFRRVGRRDALKAAQLLARLLELLIDLRLRLLGQEVFPAVREMAKEFDLKSPFETNQPVSLAYMNAAREPIRAAAE